MNRHKVILISPPFSSQLTPTLALAEAFREEGLHTIIACGESFKEKIQRDGFGFVPLLVNRNSNTGIAQQTKLPEEERRRLHSFLESTKKGAVATLLLQSRDRREDMFADPESLFHDVERINRNESPDLWVANQLSYAVTLVLYCLDYPFITFCPPHPLTIPKGKKIYGVPGAWPSSIPVDKRELDTLIATATEVEKSFTEEFNQIIRKRGTSRRIVANAFRLTSQKAVFFNYPDFKEGPRTKYNAEEDTREFYLGSCFEEEPLPPAYEKRLAPCRDKKPKILLVLGTFLSYREDVLNTCIASTKKRFPNSVVIVGAGASAEVLRKMELEDVLVEEYVPQKALIPHMDVIMHHGGNNTFTESLYYGKPMIIMPFSSDQFDVASDAEKYSLAPVLDPNSLNYERLASALQLALSGAYEGTLSHWSKHVRSRGPRYAVRKLLYTENMSTEKCQ